MCKLVDSCHGVNAIQVTANPDEIPIIIENLFQNNNLKFSPFFSSHLSRSTPIWKKAKESINPEIDNPMVNGIPDIGLTSVSEINGNQGSQPWLTQTKKLNKIVNNIEPNVAFKLLRTTLGSNNPSIVSALALSISIQRPNDEIENSASSGTGERMDGHQIWLTECAKIGFEVEVKQYFEGTRTSQDAADQLGCEVAHIAKSIVFKGESGLEKSLDFGIFSHCPKESKTDEKGRQCSVDCCPNRGGLVPDQKWEQSIAVL